MELGGVASGEAARVLPWRLPFVGHHTKAHEVALGRVASGIVAGVEHAVPPEHGLRLHWQDLCWPGRHIELAGKIPNVAPAGILASAKVVSPMKPSGSKGPNPHMGGAAPGAMTVGSGVGSRAHPVPIASSIAIAASCPVFTVFAPPRRTPS